MPLLEFACGTCGKKVEVLVRATDEAVPPRCPGCGGETERKFAAFNAGKGHSGSSPSPSCGGGCGGARPFA